MPRVTQGLSIATYLASKSGSNRNVKNSIFLKPGVSDFCLAVVLAIGSALGVTLDPSNRDSWLIVPLGVAAPLVLTGALLVLNDRVATTLAVIVHVLLLIAVAFGMLLCLLLFVTVLFFGAGLVLLPPLVLLAANSGLTLGLTGARRRGRLARGLAGRAT